MPGALDDDGFVGHRRHVGAARGARAHHDRDLRDALGRHPRLVEEDPAEVIAIGEDLGLERQERAAGIDQVDAGQAVLQRDLLRADVLLDGQRIVGAAFDRRVVGDDQHFAARDAADAGDDARARARRRRTCPRRRAARARGTASPGSSSLSMRSRTGSLPCSRCRCEVFSPPPAATARCRVAQLRDERRHALVIAAELVADAGSTWRGRADP